MTVLPSTSMTDETTEFLIRARGFIERGWCRYVLAEDAEGNCVGPMNKRAARWCANGAMLAAGVERQGYYENPACIRLATAVADGNPAINRRFGQSETPDAVAIFNNDQKTVEPVLAAFDRAIAAGREG